MRIAALVLISCWFVFFSTPSFGQFAYKDVTKDLGLTGLSGGTAAWVDYDNDGWMDIQSGNQLWRNRNGKKFELSPHRFAATATWGDFDNDGFEDAYAFNGKPLLYRNIEGKKFEVVKDAFPKLPMAVSLGAAWLDMDKDGDLDLYVGGYEIWQKANYLDVILENRDGKFVEVWRQKTVRTARGITTCDYDNDSDVDIYVSNYRLFPNLLWQNNGKGQFKNVAAETGTDGDGELGAWGHTIGSAWGDLDNDGNFDLFVGNFSHPPAYQDRPKFLRNLGAKRGYKFKDESADAGLQWQESFASPTLADINNDGNLDLFFSTVYPRDKSALYLNRGKWKFENVSKGSNVQMVGTYQSAFGDFNNDGQVDLLSGGRLFQNPGNDNHWIRIQLEGTEATVAKKINRSLIGTQVRIRYGKVVMSRQLTSAVGQGNQNDPTFHFGLGKHSGNVQVEIRWPDGTTHTSKAGPDETMIIRHR